MEREKLSCRLGFILISAGCAMSLGAEISGNSPGCAESTAEAALC